MIYQLPDLIGTVNIHGTIIGEVGPVAEVSISPGIVGHRGEYWRGQVGHIGCFGYSDHFACCIEFIDRYSLSWLCNWRRAIDRSCLIRKYGVRNDARMRIGIFMPDDGAWNVGQWVEA